MAHDERRTEILVGTFVGLGLLLLAVLILTFGNVRDLFREKYRVTVSFPSAGELSRRSHVSLGGATIGRVEGKPLLNSTFDGVTVDLEIYDEIAIPEGSTFKIATSGLMGDAFIEIEPPAELTGRSIEKGAFVDGRGSAGLSAITDAATDLSAQAKQVMQDVRISLEKVNTSLERINTGILAPENLDRFRESLAKLNSAVAKFDDGILADENVEALKVALASIRDASESLSAGAADFQPLVADAREAVGKVGPTIERFGETAEKFSGTAEQVDAVVSDLRDGEGVLGALLNDPGVKADMVSLIRNLRRHGILFYRDSAGGAAPGEEAGAPGQAAPPPDRSRPRAARPPGRP